jgi:shikimate kinase
MKSEILNIYLCGMMGSGKSAVGKNLAEKLSLPFYDLDSIIEEKVSVSIPEIFSTKGESYFRETEQKVLADHLKNNKGVTALGGGSLQTAELTDNIKENATLVFIEAPLSVLLNRLKSDKTRPMIADTGNDETQLRERLMKLIEQREPLYKMAHLHIDAGTKNTDELASEIVLKIREIYG